MNFFNYVINDIQTLSMDTKKINTRVKTKSTKKCIYCRNIVKNELYKTIIHKSKAPTAYFCNLTCFEMMSENDMT